MGAGDFETTRKYDKSIIVTPSGEIKKRRKVLNYTTDDIKQLALRLGASKNCGVYSVEKDNDLVVLIDSETDWEEFPWKNRYNTIYVIGKLQSKITFSYVKCNILDLSELDTSDIIDMSHMFSACEAQSIDLSNFNTSNVTNMRSMFNGCRAQSLDLSNLDTSKVTDMSYMLSGGCIAQSLDLSSFDTSSVTNMCHMFSGCRAQSLDLSNFDTSNVTDMSQMFYWCEAKSLNLARFNAFNLVDMSAMFYRCNEKCEVICSDNKIAKEAERQGLCVRRV